MRIKSVVTGLRRRSITPGPTPSVSPIPNLSTTFQENNHNATVYNTDDSNDNNTHAPTPDFVPDTDPEDSLDDNSCITCNKAGGALLVCTQTDCPITVHVNCIGSEPNFDDSGNFSCPYCSYKVALKKTRELRDKAVRAKNVLSSFLDKGQTVHKDKENCPVEPVKPESVLDHVNRDEHEHEHEPEVTGSEKGQTVHKDKENHPVETFKPKSVLDNVNQAAHEQEVTDSEKGQTVHKDNENRPVEPVKPDSVLDDVNRAEHEPEVSDSEKGKKQNDNVNDEDKGSVSESGSSVSETKDSDSSFCISVKKGSASAKRKVASVKKSVLSKRKAADAAGDGGDGEEEEVTSSRRTISRRREVKKQTLFAGKRRKLFWTAEEEKVLKEGVSKFSTENQNIPWRKILEFGCRVFDSTRTPVDLKDKWRNLVKQGSK